MDAYDWAIVSELSKDCRQTTRQMAMRLPMSEATVRRRLKHLTQGGVISTRALTLPKELGYKVSALIFLSIQVDRVSRIMEVVRQYDNIIYAAIMSGGIDIVLLGLFRSSEDMLHFMESKIGRLDGIRATETLVCLKTEKGKYYHLGPQAAEAAAQIIAAPPKTRRSSAGVKSAHVAPDKKHRARSTKAIA